jgi:hypothetical protein
MRQGIDADAKLADLVRLFKNLAIDAPRLQHQGCRQPANSATNDNRLHTQRPAVILIRPIMPSASAQAQ